MCWKLHLNNKLKIFISTADIHWQSVWANNNNTMGFRILNNYFFQPTTARKLGTLEDYTRVLMPSLLENGIRAGRGADHLPPKKTTDGIHISCMSTQLMIPNALNITCRTILFISMRFINLLLQTIVQHALWKLITSCDVLYIWNK